MAYLDFETYQAYGGTLDDTTFADLEFQAETVIDWYTFSRLQNEETYPERVKRCVFALIKLFQNKMLATAVPLPTGQSADGGALGVYSQSNDGVSVTYNVMSATELMKNSDSEIKRAIRMYLDGVTDSLGRKVLYRGLYPGE